MADPLEHTLDKTGRLDDETIRVVESVLCDTHPPINPAVLLLAKYGQEPRINDEG